MANIPTGPKDEDTDSRVIIPASPTDEACFKQVHSWLSKCSEHASCPKPKPAQLPNKIIELPKDSIEPPRLISGEGKEGSYLTLSYSNGDSAPVSIPSIEQHISLTTLPSIFADAITIARHLGFQYLWIASLCASPTDQLSRVFSQSTLMLSASIATSLDSGLLHERTIHYSPALGTNKDRFLRRHDLRWVDQIERGPLARRGWATLERIFAPRILHYTSQQMIFECADGYKFEASNIPDKKYGAGQIRQQYKKSYVQPYITAALSPPTTSAISSETSDASPSTETYLNRLEAWQQCVDHFTKGQFTNPTDKLAAIEPLARLLNSDGILGTYLAGLWSKNIGYGLSWGRVYQVLTPAPSYRAPSWSWASVDNETSSMMLVWPRTLLDTQTAHPAWINKHGPKLLDSHVETIDSQVQPGAWMQLEASLLPFTKLTKWLEEKNEPSLFGITFVLDQTWVFDCPCCGEQHTDEERAETAKKFTEEKECHVCMVIQGDGWADKDSVVEIVVLKKRDLRGETEEYERIGFLRLQLEYYYKPVWQNEDESVKSGFVDEAFEGMGWERKTVRLF